MALDPAWMLYILADLTTFAEANCRSEVAIHLDAARRNLTPYLAEEVQVDVPDARVQTAKDMVEELITFAHDRDLDEMLHHLIAARQTLEEGPVDHEQDHRVVAFPTRRLAEVG